MSERASVHVTLNFERNLEDLREYLQAGSSPGAFERLVDLLLETVVPNLERFPRMGLDFLSRRPRSAVGALKVRALEERIGQGASLREYIIGDYILLYLERGERVDLLAVKHHRQLSFDLRGHWVP